MSTHSEHESVSASTIWLTMALFVITGSPMVAYLWETLTELLALTVNFPRLLVSIPVLLLFVGLLVLMARTVSRWGKLEKESH